MNNHSWESNGNNNYAKYNGYNVWLSQNNLEVYLLYFDHIWPFYN